MGQTELRLNGVLRSLRTEYALAECKGGEPSVRGSSYLPLLRSLLGSLQLAKFSEKDAYRPQNSLGIYWLVML
jgi:hypothetical protein